MKRLKEVAAALFVDVVLFAAIGFGPDCYRHHHPATATSTDERHHADEPAGGRDPIVVITTSDPISGTS